MKSAFTLTMDRIRLLNDINNYTDTTLTNNVIKKT